MAKRLHYAIAVIAPLSLNICTLESHHKTYGGFFIVTNPVLLFLWNGGNGTGIIKLYKKTPSEEILIDEIAAKNIGCEYGGYSE